jgi:hypothetical protein
MEITKDAKAVNQCKPNSGREDLRKKLRNKLRDKKMNRSTLVVKNKVIDDTLKKSGVDPKKFRESMAALNMDKKKIRESLSCL